MNACLYFSVSKDGDVSAELMAQREAHYEKYLGDLDQVVMKSTGQKPVNVDIYTFAPTEERPFYVLITGGMSDQRQNIPEDWDIAPRAELMLYTLHPKGWMYSVLRGLAEMCFEKDTFLSYRHTIPNGRPMTSEPSLLTAFTFLPPQLEEDGFQSMQVDGDDTDLLLLVPITEAEREYAVEQGTDDLYNLFAQHLDPVIDEHRSCVVTGQQSPSVSSQAAPLPLSTPSSSTPSSNTPSPSTLPSNTPPKDADLS